MKITHSDPIPQLPYQDGIIAYLHKHLPKDHRIVLGEIDEDAIHELWKIRGQLSRTFRPMEEGMSFGTYYMRFAPLKLVERFYRKYHELKIVEVLLEENTERCNADDKDGITRHQRGKWILPYAPTQYDKLEYRDVLMQMNEIAEMMDLKGVIPMLALGMSERKIAEKLEMPKTTLHDKIERMKTVLRRFFAEILK